MHDFWSTITSRRGSGEHRSAYRSVLDLGTDQIKALVLELKGRECLVVGAGNTARQPGVPRREHTAAEVSAMGEKCDQALQEAEDMTAGACDTQVVPDLVVVGLPSCVTTGRTFGVTHHRPKPEKRISQKELSEVVKRAQRLALKQLLRSTDRSGASQSENAELLEGCVTDIRVDGRSVTNPVGFRGRNLAVAVFNVAISSSYLRAVEALATDLGLEIVTAASGWQSLASALAERECICIDVGGRATDVLLVRNGKPLATASASVGGVHFTKRLAEAFGLTWTDAEGLKMAYSRGQLGGRPEVQVGKALGEVMNDWLRGVETTLKRMSASHPLPHRFYLCGGGSCLRGLLTSMRSHPWMRELTFSRHPEVQVMQPRDVPHVLDRTGRLRGREHVAPLALAGYLTTLGVERDSFGPLLRQVKSRVIFRSAGGNA